jgi:membrane glycosyltransferase
LTPRENNKHHAWEIHARLRRIALLGLIVLTCIVGGQHIAHILPHRGTTILEVAIVIVFATLFAWISIGFWEAMAGLFTLLRPYDRFAVTKSCREKDTLLGIQSRTAILVPICNEEVERVFACLYANFRSLEETGQGRYFDFYILSDSSRPDIWVEEEIAWSDACRNLDAYGRIFYRRRRVNLKRKSGNIADFCRRWGRNYQYMIVLDADSIMSGSTIVRMVGLMNAHPKTGILQTAPFPVNRESLISRIQQFASRLYGPMFNAGLHFMQLGDSHFWGHNAIIRVAPFMQHCGLPDLPGKLPRGGHFLSHDFVEAAFMRRGGWEVWFAYDLGGSYEEIPPTLLDELKREQRWCEGNIQHFRLLFTKGLFFAHRALFLHGALSYITSPLWMLFLGLSTVEAILEVFRMPVYFSVDYALFPQWPTWYTQWAFTILSATAIMLFLPKLLSLLLIVAKGQGRSFGGNVSLILGMAAETLFAVIVAPIRMLSHTKFVLYGLLGRTVGWSAQRRSDRGTGWLDAIRFHGFGTVLGVIWGGLLLIYNRSFFWWNTPIIIPLIFSVPLSVWSSHVRVGRALRKLGLFVIPEEIDPPPVLKSLQDNLLQNNAAEGHFPAVMGQGFVRAVVDPSVNALHGFLLRKERTVSPAIRKRRDKLREKALADGPGSLSPKEKKELLSDPFQMRQMHLKVWEISDQRLAERWGIGSLSFS